MCICWFIPSSPFLVVVHCPSPLLCVVAFPSPRVHFIPLWEICSFTHSHFFRSLDLTLYGDFAITFPRIYCTHCYVYFCWVVRPPYFPRCYTHIRFYIWSFHFTFIFRCLSFVVRYGYVYIPLTHLLLSYVLHFDHFTRSFSPRLLLPFADLFILHWSFAFVHILLLRYHSRCCVLFTFIICCFICLCLHICCILFILFYLVSLHIVTYILRIATPRYTFVRYVYRWTSLLPSSFVVVFVLPITFLFSVTFSLLFLVLGTHTTLHYTTFTLILLLGSFVYLSFHPRCCYIYARVALHCTLFTLHLRCWVIVYPHLFVTIAFRSLRSHIVAYIRLPHAFVPFALRYACNVTLTSLRTPSRLTHTLRYVTVSDLRCCCYYALFYAFPSFYVYLCHDFTTLRLFVVHVIASVWFIIRFILRCIYVFSPLCVPRVRCSDSFAGAR